MKNKVCAVFLSLALLFAGGCWDYQELNTLTIVSGMALDVNPQGQTLFTAELAHVESGQKDVESRLVEGEGPSCIAASQAAAGNTGRRLYLGHTQTVAVSADLARNGMEQVLDYLSRQHDMPLSLALVVSREDTAAKLLETPPVTEILAGYEIAMRASEEGQQGPYMPFYQFYSEVQEKGIDPYLPAVAAGEEGTLSQGAALFQESRLVGFLDEEETDTLLMLRGKKPSGAITVLRSPEEGGNVTFTLDTCRLTLRTALTPQGQVQGTLSLRAEVMVSELAGDQPLLSQEGRRQLESLCSAELTQRGQALLQKLQKEFACDPLGLGLDLSRRQPAEWEQIKEQWHTFFSQADLNLSVQVQVTGTGRMYLPAARAN